MESDSRDTTAAELRSWGLAISENIPDLAVIPRSAIRVTFGAMNIQGNVATVDTLVSFTEPFKWLEVKMVVSK